MSRRVEAPRHTVRLTFTVQVRVARLPEEPVLLYIRLQNVLQKNDNFLIPLSPCPTALLWMALSETSLACLKVVPARRRARRNAAIGQASEPSTEGG